VFKIKKEAIQKVFVSELSLIGKLLLMSELSLMSEL